MPFSGGFQGRTNKLVDGCYSFWQASVFDILHQNNFAVLAKSQVSPAVEEVMDKREGEVPKIEVIEDFYVEEEGLFLFNQIALQEYVILACQDSTGGLVDKPGQPKDLYHTCYCLSGLSLAQNNPNGTAPSILGISTNKLLEINSVHNIPKKQYEKIFEYFKDKPLK